MTRTVQRNSASSTTRVIRRSGSAPPRPRSINTRESSDIARSGPTDTSRSAAAAAAFPQRSARATVRSVSAIAASPRIARVDPGRSRTPLNAPRRASREASDRVRGPKTTSSDPSHTMSIDASGWTPSACDPTVTVSRHVAATHVASSCVAGLAIGTQLGFVNVLYLYAFTAIGAAFSALDGPARGALTPSLLQREQLPAAMALNQVLFQTASIAGPAMAGVVILAFGVAGAYWIDVASFIVAIGAVTALVAPPREVRVHLPVGRPLVEGLSHFRANRILFGTMLLDFLATFFGSPRALFPFYADRVFAVGPEGLGLLFAAPGVGSLIAALGSGWTKRVQRQRMAVLLAVAAWGLAIAAFGLMNDGLFVPALVFIAVAQGADTVSAIFRSTILLTVVPDHLRGRLVAISSMFFLGGPYLGQVESGVVADIVSQ